MRTVRAQIAEWFASLWCLVMSVALSRCLFTTRRWTTCHVLVVYLSSVFAFECTPSLRFVVVAVACVVLYGIALYRLVSFCVVCFSGLSRPVVCRKDWVLQSFLPMSSLENLSVGQALCPPTKWTTSLCRPCSPPHVCHHPLGCLHWLAHAARYAHFFGLDILAHSKETTVSLSKMVSKKNRCGRVLCARRAL